MNKGEALLWFAHYLPEWMYGRTLLAKIALGYMIINALHNAQTRSTTLEA